MNPCNLEPVDLNAPRPSAHSCVGVCMQPHQASTLRTWWPRSSLTQHSHFDRGGRGRARPSIHTFMVVAAEWPDTASVPLHSPLHVSLSFVFRPVPPILLRMSLLAPPNPSHLQCLSTRLQNVCYLFSQCKLYSECMVSNWPLLRVAKDVEVGPATN